MEIQPYNVQVRFNDCDMMGHVNNAVYFSYLENARVYYFGQLFGPNRDWKKEGMILRTNEIEYLAPIYLHDHPSIELYVERIGSKSFTAAYEIRVNGQLKSIAKSVLVWFNSETQTSFEASEETKELLQQLKRI